MKSQSPSEPSFSSMSSTLSVESSKSRSTILEQSANRRRRDSLLCASSRAIQKTVAAHVEQLQEEIALSPEESSSTVTEKRESRRNSATPSSADSETYGDELLEDFPTSAQTTFSRSTPDTTDDMADNFDDESSSLSSSPTTTVVDLQEYAKNTHTNNGKLKSCLSNPNFQSSTKRKSVKFAQTATCMITPPKTDKDLLQAWYTQGERIALQKQARRAVKLRRRSLSEGDLYRNHGESGRGIEHYSHKAVLQKYKQEQDNVIDAVLLLQQHWCVKGLPFDAQELAYTSYTLSALARDRAYLHGAEDAAAAKSAAGSLLGIGSRRSKSLS